MKKTMELLISLALSVGLMPTAVLAENTTPFTDTIYWNGYCSAAENSTSEDCERYRVYVRSQTGNLSDQLNEVETKKKQFEQDVTQYQDEIAQLQSDIEALQSQMAEVQAQIDATQAEIDATQADISALREKIKRRMVLNQSSLKTNKYLDVLLSASTLADWLRIISGLEAIFKSDQKTNEEFMVLLDQLNQQQASQQAEKEELSALQGTYIVKKDTVSAAEAAAEDQIDALIEQGSSVSSNIEANKEILAAIAIQVAEIPSSVSWTYPVPNGYTSLGTWNYPDGSAHLGNDLTAASGSKVVAAVNGVIISSSNGCGTGYLGNSCGYQYGGLAGAGNQVVELAAVDGSLYAIEYDHLLLGTPAETGTVVYAGDQIGEVGSSGNSAEPHCHVEIFYLGDASLFTEYLSSWIGDLLFGAGNKGDGDGYGRRCDAGYDAPCRIRPESVIGS